MNRLAVLALAGFFSITASAENWLVITESVNSDLVLVDTESIVHSGKITQAFLKNILAKSKTLPNGQPYNTRVILQQFNCTSSPRTVKTLAITARYNNHTVHSGNFGSYAPWQIIYPDTINSVVADYVCSY